MKSTGICKILLVVAVICSSAWAADQRSLTISSTVGGTVAPGIGTYWYDYNISTNIAAYANTGYHFVNWTGTAVDAGKVADPNATNTSVTMDANYTVRANFAIWTPTSDGSLTFNLNFEAHTLGPPPTTTDAKAGFIGTLYDYNASNYNIWQPGKVGFDANFGDMFDKVPKDRPNDCKIKIPYNSIFDLGNYDVKHTYSLWFNLEDLSEGTFIRHANTYAEDPLYPDQRYLWWEIRVFGGKLQFYHGDSHLRMETTDTLADMGLSTGTWYHAVIVVNRTLQAGSKIYINGLQVPVTTTYDTDNASIASAEPLWVGAGDRQFDGALDEVLFFNGELTALQACILNQLDGTEKPIALNPFPGSSNVLISTGMSWDPDPCATRQTFYFDDDNDVRTDPLYSNSDDGNDMKDVNNAQMGIGLLNFNTTYYWVVDTNVSGTMIPGPLWSFTTETGKAINPWPGDGNDDVNAGLVDFAWTTPTPGRYDLYVSSDIAQIQASDGNCRKAQNITDNNVQDVCTPERGTTYYWRVDTNYTTTGFVQGDIWSYTTKAYDIIFNTKNGITRYADHDFNALECVLHGNGWTKIGQGSLDANVGTAVNSSDANGGLAVFNFDDPNGFNYDHRYHIVVIPALRAQDVCYTEANIPIPLAIHVNNGSFYFDGKILLAGDNITDTIQDDTWARSGGFPGPAHNTAESSGQKYFWAASKQIPVGSYTRFGVFMSAKFAYEANDAGKQVFGPGVPVVPPYKGGGGGGYGGVGGDCGRGYWSGVFCGGPSYGDKEVPVPFGGSAGGGGSGSSPGGAAGGGGIEIVATGDIVLDSNSQIRANGGSQLCSPVNYAAGGGAGGSVKLIADGNITLKGIIDVNGGKGGDASGQTQDNIDDTGGGGAGGRVAIIYGGNYDKTGSTIAYKGGFKGVDLNGHALAEGGQDGTLYEVKSSPVRRKASAPTPQDGSWMVYCPNSTSGNWLTLKWYSGYNKTDACDIVYFGTSMAAMTPKGMVSATRGQHSCPNDVNIVPDKTYYWKVQTVAADGNADSNTWSFQAVNWKCPIAAENNDSPTDANSHISGPRWDSNHDCVLNFNDFWYFAKNWRNVNAFGTDYTLDEVDLHRFINEWLDCRARTNNGCSGW
jgi:hypothetical protein